MTDGAVRLSVIIPCLDEAGMLGTQLEALATQHRAPSWEVLVVDNGSSDSTVAVAESFRGRVPALRVLHEERRGRHHACNRGARAARGEGLAFVDADDEVHPGFVAGMIEGLAAHAMVAGRLDHGRFDATVAPGDRVVDGVERGLGFLPFASGACTGIRASVFAEVGGFDEDAAYCEDAALSWRVQLAGHELGVAGAAVVAYRQRASARAMFRQHRNYGKAQVWLYTRFRDAGMPRRTAREVATDWWRVVASVPFLANPDVRVRFVRRLGRNVGRVAGSLRQRTVYL